MQPAPDWATPNAIAILLAMQGVGETQSSSPKTDEIGWCLGKDARWVWRHGGPLIEAGLVQLSMNGHCWVDTAAGDAVKTLLGSAPPEEGKAALSMRRPGAVFSGSRAVCTDGTVLQWLPTALPGHLPQTLPLRSAKAHGSNPLWVTVKWHRGYNTERRAQEASEMGRRTRDGSMTVAPGMQVEIGRGCAAFRGVRRHPAVVSAVNGDCCLVTGDGFVNRIVPLDHVLAPGAPDPTALNHTQQAVAEALMDGTAEVVPNDREDENPVAIIHGGRRVHPGTTRILIENGWVPDPASVFESLHPTGIGS
jgi:hypothetical protein